MPDDFDFSKSPSTKKLSALENFPAMTYLIAVACITIFAANQADKYLGMTAAHAIGQIGRNQDTGVWNGHYSDLFTCVLAHAQILHIAFNMMWFIQLGTILETSLNPLAFIALLFASAVVGAGCQLALDGQTGIGMSGVVYAMFGLVWAGRYSFTTWRDIATPRNFQMMFAWGIFCVFTTMTHMMPVANGAHAGGFIFGLSIGYLFLSPRRRTLWAVPLTAIVAVAIIGCTWAPWTESWNWWRATRAFHAQDYTTAIRYYKAALNHGATAHDCYYNISASWHNIAGARAKRDDIAGAREALRQEQAALDAGGYDAAVDSRLANDRQ